MSSVKFIRHFALWCIILRAGATPQQQQQQSGREGHRVVKGSQSPSTDEWGLVKQHVHSDQTSHQRRSTEGPGKRNLLNETAVTTTSTVPPTPTQQRLDLVYTEGSIQTLLQRFNDRLTTLEALESRQLRKLDNIDYRITRLELLGQDKSGLDKSEDYVTRKIENVEWEINKYGTLLDVIRQDLDKISQKQTELKLTLSKTEADSTTTTNVTRGGDMPAKLQAIVFQVQGIRKTTDEMHSNIYILRQNLTDVINVTRSWRATSQNMQQLMSKQYFHTAMREFFAPLHQHPTTISIRNCQHDGATELTTHDCSQVQQLGHNQSGIYRIQPHDAPQPVFVRCDLEEDGGGWTIIQRRFDGSVNFYREWHDYKHGFGNVAGEYWLGNENVYHITKRDVYELRVQLEDYNDGKARATYSAFALGSEIEGYMIKLLGDYSGDAGDSLMYHAGMKFSTSDMDNDQWTSGNCAETHTGGWWYKECDMVNLNGQYLGGEVPEALHYQGVYWYEWHGPQYSLHKVEMKIRPATFRSGNE